MHVQDIARVIGDVLTAPKGTVNGQIFNVGSDQNTLKVINLAYITRENLPFETVVKVTPSERDYRSYRVGFQKIRQRLNFSPQYSIVDGIREVYEALKQGIVWDSPDTVTVKWYKHLIDSHAFLKDVVLNGEVL